VLGRIKLLPERMVREDGDLLSLKAWCLHFTGQFDELAKVMVALESLSADQVSTCALGRLLNLKT
jgi:hypothetical protein